MAILLPIDVDRISARDLTDMFEKFCELYEITTSGKDRQTIEEKGIEELRKNGYFLHLPVNGGVWETRKTLDGVEIDGCKFPSERSNSRRQRSYEDSLIKYFGQRLESLSEFEFTSKI